MSKNFVGLVLAACGLSFSSPVKTKRDRRVRLGVVGLEERAVPAGFVEMNELLQVPALSVNFGYKAPELFKGRISKDAVGAGQVKQLVFEVTEGNLNVMQNYTLKFADVPTYVGQRVDGPGERIAFTFDSSKINMGDFTVVSSMVKPTLAPTFHLSFYSMSVVDTTLGPTLPLEVRVHADARLSTTFNITRPVVASPVSVALSSDTPATGWTIVGGQAAADLAHFTFIGNGVVSSVTLKRSGISDNSTLSNVYLFDGNMPITEGYSFNVNNEITINGLSLVVNGFKTISVRGDVPLNAPNSASSIAVAITGYIANNVVSTTNVAGNIQYIVIANLAKVDFGANTTSPTANVPAGATNTTLWAAPVQVSTRNVWMKMINFQVTGGGPGDGPGDNLTNIKLYVDGVDTGKVAIVTKTPGVNYAFASFDLFAAPIAVMVGTHTVEARGDILKERNGRIQLSLARSIDVTFFDPQVGINVTPTSAGYSSFYASNSGSVVTVFWPALMASKNTAYPNQTLPPNTSSNRIASVVFQDQSTSDTAELTGFIVSIAYGAGTNSSNLSALRTSESSGNAATPIQPATAAAGTSGTNTFVVNKMLAPGFTYVLDILADSGTDTGSTATVTVTVTAIYKERGVELTSPVVGQTMTFGIGRIINPPTLVTSTSSVSQYIAAAGGVTDATRATFNIVSIAGSSTITELKFVVVGDVHAVTSVRVGNVSAQPVAGVAYLTGLNLTVPNSGSGLNLDAYVSYGDVSINGTASWTKVAIGISYIKYVSAGTTQVLDLSAKPSMASEMTLVASSPSVSLGLPNGAAGSSANGLTVGTVYAADVIVTANSKGDIKLNNLAVTMTGNAPGTHIDGALTVVKDSQGVVIPGATVIVSGGNDADTISIIKFPIGYLIPAGTSETFKIEIVVTALAGATTGDSVSIGVDPVSFNWTDYDGTVIPAGLDGQLIANFPKAKVSIKN